MENQCILLEARKRTEERYLLVRNKGNSEQEKIFRDPENQGKTGPAS